MQPSIYRGRGISRNGTRPAPVHRGGCYPWAHEPLWRSPSRTHLRRVCPTERAAIAVWEWNLCRAGAGGCPFPPFPERSDGRGGRALPLVPSRPPFWKKPEHVANSNCAVHGLRFPHDTFAVQAETPATGGAKAPDAAAPPRPMVTPARRPATSGSGSGRSTNQPQPPPPASAPVARRAHARAPTRQHHHHRQAPT